MSAGVAPIAGSNLPLSNIPAFLFGLEMLGGEPSMARFPVSALANDFVASNVNPPAAATLAQLNGWLNYAENTGATVVADTDVTKTGIYRKVGASGTGSWVKIAELYGAEAAARLLLARDLGAIPLSGVSHANFNTITATIVSNAATTGLNGTGSTSKFVFTPTTGNTGPCTLAISGGPTYPLTRGDGTPLRPGDLKAGETIIVQRRADNTYRIITTTFKTRTLEGGLKQSAASVVQSHGNAVSWDTGRPAFTVQGPTTGLAWYAAQPVAGRDMLLRCITAGQTIDLTWMSVGTSVKVYSVSQTFVFAGDAGAYFLGQATNINRASLPANSCATFTCVGTGRIFVEASSAAIAYTTFVRPAMAVTVLYAGQSHMVIGYSSGAIGGFAREMMSNDIGATTGGQPDRRAFFFINGATGGTAVAKSSVEPGATNYWWDETANNGAGEPGPMLNDCVARINAGVALGQPWPSVVNWGQGDGDGLDIQFGVTKASVFKANTLAVWNYLRAYRPPGWPTNSAPPMADMKVIVWPPGSVDSYFTTTGMVAERTAFFELVQEYAWVNYGGEMYDLPRNRGQEHLTDDGCYGFGQRHALAFKRVMSGQTIDRGPILESATYYAGRNVLEIKVRGDSANGSSPWPMLDPGPTDDDLNPFGFQVFRGSFTDKDTPITSPSLVPIKVLDARCINNSANAFRRFTYEFIMESDPTGAKVYSVADWSQHQWRRSYPMSEVQHPPCVGMPITFQIVSVQAQP